VTFADGCWESGGPEWLFNVAVFAGPAAVFAFIVWGLLWAAGPPRPIPLRCRLLNVAVGLALVVFLTLMDWRLASHSLVGIALTYLPVIAAYALTRASLSRQPVAGVAPPALKALPRFVRWSLPAVGAVLGTVAVAGVAPPALKALPRFVRWSLPAVGTVLGTAAVTAGVAMIVLGHPC